MKLGLSATLIVLTMLVSGCDTVNAGNGGNTGTTILGQVTSSNDIVTLDNIAAFPTEVQPERNFLLSGYVTNNANKKVDNVNVEITDYCSSVFDVTKTLCYLTSSDGYSPCRLTLNQAASYKLQWNFKAPTADRTAGRDFNCNIVVKTSYAYTAYGSVNVVLASDADIAARETPQTSVTGEGPVKIYITVQSPQPIGKSDKFDIKVVLKDEGGGEVDGGGIPDSDFDITGSQDLTVKCQKPKVIQLSSTKKEAEPIFCTVTTPNSIPPRVIKTLIGQAPYHYKFSNTIPIKLAVVKQTVV